jgi:hypothetical protein
MPVVQPTENAMPTTTASTTNVPNTADAELFAKVMARTYRFRERRHAFGFASHAAKSQRVMLGDDGRYWVVTPADAARLERMGYEYAG